MTLPIDFTDQTERDVLIGLINTAILNYVDNQLSELDYTGYQAVQATQQVMEYLDDNLIVQFKDQND